MAKTALPYSRNNLSVLGKARKAARYFDIGASEDEVALWFGVSTVTIGNWMKLLSINPGLIAEVERGTVSASAAIQVADNPKAQQTLIQKARAGATSKPGRPKGKAVTARPNRTAVRKMYDQLTNEGTSQAQKAMAQALGWVLGVVSNEDFISRVSGS